MTQSRGERLAFARDRISRFVNDRQGNVAPIFAIAMIPVFGLMGSAVDYSRASSIKAAMQAATDATALSLVQSALTTPTGDVSDTATRIFRATFDRPDALQLHVTAVTDISGTATVSASAQMNTDFMGVVGVSTMTIGSRAVAKKTAGDGSGCVLSLSKTASGAIVGQGSTTVALNNCSLYDNSNNASALTVGGSASVSALSVSVVGGISGSAAISTSQGIRTGVSPIADPYAGVSVPSFSGCDQTNFSGKNKITINPGVYCGGMQFNANADVTFNPGVYFIDRGTFSVNGGAILQGTGVTIIFTSSTGSDWPTAQINGGATVDLRPPTSGPLSGLVMFGDRRIPSGTAYKFNGGATQYLGGAVYFPTGAVDFAGGAGANTTCTQVIGDTVSFTGNSGLAINCAGYGTKPITPNNVRLMS
jgi:Flp pilus assembly protein TadG